MEIEFKAASHSQNSRAFMPLLTHNEAGVPSSANWKPTKPLTSKHQNMAVTKPP